VFDNLRFGVWGKAPTFFLNMKIEEILKTEDNLNIYLHNEGLFWRAYEYSAFTFVKSIKQYNAKKKFIKKVNSDIVNLSSLS